MSRGGRYEVEVTLDLGERGEVDCFVVAQVAVEPSRSRGWDASVDGDVDVYDEARDAWVPIGTTGADAESIERAIDALCEKALEDDTSECVEHDYFDEEG